MYYAICITFGLATLFVVGSAGSCALLLGGRRLSALLRSCPAGIRAELLFALRLSPLMAALLITFIAAVPGFFILEPLGTGEAITPGLTVLALAGAVAVATVIVRSALLLRHSARLQRRLIAAGEPIPGFERCYCAKAPAAMVAVAGIFRPTVFVSADVLSMLSGPELRAVLAHEMAHVSAADNLKRFLMAVSGLPVGPVRDHLQHSWSVASELAADARAVSSRSAALELASALVKVGMLKLSAPCLDPLMSQLVTAQDPCELHDRVDALRCYLEGGAQRTAAAERRTVLGARVGLGLLLAAAIYLLSAPPVLSACHELLEFMVR